MSSHQYTLPYSAKFGDGLLLSLFISYNALIEIYFLFYSYIKVPTFISYSEDYLTTAAADNNVRAFMFLFLLCIRF